MRKMRAITLAFSVAVVVWLVAVVIAVPLAGARSPESNLAAPGSLNVNLDQWANTDSQWQNGNLNGNNSAYAEGNVVPFRLAIEGLDAGEHTIHINYDFTAGGHKAYDFLASYNVSESPDVCATGGGAVSSLCGALPSPLLVDFPSDSFSANGLTVSGAEAGVERKLRIYGASSASISAPTHSGDVNGNSTADIVVTFQATGSAVLLVWGGHLAQSTYWDNNAPADGAGQISGAPWHMRTQDLDGSGNKNQDRSIQPSALGGSDNTPTPTEVPPTATPTEVPPTATPTEVPPTATPTEVPPTATPTEVPPTATPTEVPPTATPTEVPLTATPTEVPPSATPTNTPEGPTSTPTNTPEGLTATPTNTPVPPTNTPVPPTNTPTNTPTLPPPGIPAPAVVAREVATPTNTPTPEPVIASAVATPIPTVVAPARLPRSGGVPQGLLVAIVTGGSALVGTGLFIRRRRKL